MLMVKPKINQGGRWGFFVAREGEMCGLIYDVNSINLFSSYWPMGICKKFAKISAGIITTTLFSLMYRVIHKLGFILRHLRQYSEFQGFRS
jgi:hypothetical protein